MAKYNSSLHVALWLKGILPFLSDEFGKVPSIRILAEMKGCSIATMHKAVKDLELENFLISKHGHGTFVKNRENSNQTQSIQNKDVLEIISKQKIIEGDSIFVVLLPVIHIGNLANKNIYNYLLDFCQGILEASIRLNVQVVIKYFESTKEKWKNSLNEIVSYINGHDVIGVITASVIDQVVFAKLADLKIPTLIVDHWASGLNLSTINPDHHGATKELVFVLASMKHKNIALLDRVDYSLNPGITDGYTAGLKGASLPVRGELLLRISSNFEKMQDVVKEIETLLLSPQRPTAFITYSIEVAVNLIKVLNRLNLKVPKDVSIISYCVKKEFIDELAISGIVFDWVNIGSYSLAKLVDAVSKKGGLSFDETFKYTFSPGSSIAFNSYEDLG